MHGQQNVKIKLTLRYSSDNQNINQKQSELCRFTSTASASLSFPPSLVGASRCDYNAGKGG